MLPQKCLVYPFVFFSFFLFRFYLWVIVLTQPSYRLNNAAVHEYNTLITYIHTKCCKTLKAAMMQLFIYHFYIYALLLDFI